MKLHYVIAEINMVYPVWVKIVLEPISTLPVTEIWLPLEAFNLNLVTGYVLSDIYTFEGTFFYKEFFTKELYKIPSHQEFFNNGEFILVKAKNRFGINTNRGSKKTTLKSFTLREIGNVAELELKEYYTTEIIPVDITATNKVNDNPNIICTFGTSDVRIILSTEQIDQYTSK